MIPIQLELRHFLSYQSAVLDLNGIHTACICGANGAGKSSLLEALTWGIWGQSRSAQDDDLIHTGAAEAQVTVTYQSRDQVYRVIRSRTRGGTSGLEWQIQTASGWRALTGRGTRATQWAIQAQLKLDYETFVNSAYLRQGRADEFSLKRPGERKQILAEILKLGQYERLAERSREHTRSAKVQLEIRQEQLDHVIQQQAQIGQIQSRQEQLLAYHQQLHQAQHQDEERIQRLNQDREQRQSLQDRCHQLTEQLAQLSATLRSTELQWRQQRHHLQDLEAWMAREAQILEGCQLYEALLAQDRQLNQTFLYRQSLQLRHQTLQTQLAQQRQYHWQQLKQLQTQLATSKAQWRLDERILQEEERIETAWKTYRQARSELRAWQRQQAQACPWLAHRQDCQSQRQQVRERILTRRTVLQHHIAHLQQEHEQIQQVEQQAVAVQVELAELEQHRRYHRQVQEKLQERLLFVHQLQERQRTLQRQWQRLEERRMLFEQGHRSEDLKQICPLCNQSLDPHFKIRVLERQEEEQYEIEEQIFVIREQLAVADREIQILQEEDQTLTQELEGIDRQLLAHGRLQHQLETRQAQQTQLQSYQQELQDLDLSLSQDTYALDLQRQLQETEAKLAAIGYDQQQHARCREEMERWRWAEGKRIELQRARHRRSRLDEQIRHLEQQIQTLQDQTPRDEQGHSLQEHIQELELELDHLEYSIESHQQVRSDLIRAQIRLTQWQTLQQVKQQHPHSKAQCEILATQLHEQRQTFMALSREIESIHHQLSQLPPVAETQIETLTAQIQQRRQALDETLSELGAVQQQLQQLSQLEEQKIGLQQQVQGSRRLVQVHHELAQAFGRNGIPALIIETVLPELESEANQILSRLTDHQLHLQLVTQRSGRRSQKVIDTLDILIADPRGTRPYETYSGGEAFRINFAIRLALSRLLAQRSGAHLQTLMIDEGFGTQDQTGRQHLVAAINAVAPDFARILVITHIPSLQDAFPHRIEVRKGPEGSHLQILS